VAAGLIGVVVSTVGIWRARSRGLTAVHDSTPSRVPDVAAYAGLVASSSALIAIVLVQFGWPLVSSMLGPGPCDQVPSVACFHAHPDYYQESMPGSFTTQQSRFGDYVLTPINGAAWPVALLGAATGVLALAFSTRRRRAAVIAVILGSVIVVLMVVQYFAFLMVGGGE
jgi:hypothetical protein